MEANTEFSTVVATREPPVSREDSEDSHFSNPLSLDLDIDIVTLSISEVAEAMRLDTRIYSELPLALAPSNAVQDINANAILDLRAEPTYTRPPSLKFAGTQLKKLKQKEKKRLSERRLKSLFSEVKEAPWSTFRLTSDLQIEFRD
ncbi:hypothetical protein TWF192_009532 [Orbilia oligospora]|uniref:Uncharacterized protein n=1 Tax=Orbilia oligospora TaxID=2813651 RepID=A0A6G1M024_ORBOL|nr:hypothetical protein TWF679_004449 [Orbilia oligospora]KAF3218860.1 hypothetical protein TWF191_008065 [Orbilia oligospora]KAF3240209.1 hypothetical protein TWF192_009532 [Orbilia oligospora]